MPFALLLAAALASGAATRPGDLEGVWTNASQTHLTRPSPRDPLVVDGARAEAITSPQAALLDADSAPTDPRKGAPAVGAPVLGVNAFWLAPGRALAKIGAGYRTSWIVDPADGQLPLSDEGKRRVAAARAFAAAADAPAGPEAMQPWDRCLISSRGSGGPGMLNNIYNSNYQIVQTRDHVAIVIEMVHDARVIALFASKAAAQAGHGPAAQSRWLGDSTGWWEGPTLVVETVGVNGEQGRAGPIFLTQQGRVVERFTRTSKTEIAYAFTVEDATYYTRPWRAEMVMSASDKPLYEYACHEGNYAMTGILNGARQTEAGAGGGR